MPRTPTDSPPRYSRGFLAGGAVVAALVVAGIGVSVGAALHHGTAAATAPATPAAAAASGGSACGLPGLDPADTAVTAAPVARWVTVGTMSAPTSPTAGPGRREGNGLRSCFAHTATGALFAVANIWAMGSDPRLYRDVLQQNTATGAGRTTALTQAVGPSNTGMSAQIAGYRITAYNPSEATVDIAFRLSTGTQISFPAPVRWEDGDWKIELVSDGTPVFRPNTLQTLAGYTPWAGTE